MDGEQKIIEAVDKVSGGAGKASKAIEKQQFDLKTEDKFNQALGDQSQQPSVSATAKQGIPQVVPIDARPNPLDVAKNIYTQKVDTTNSVEQIDKNISRVNERIEDIKETLQSPNVTIKHSYQSLLENKLTHIDESLKVALEKVGYENAPTADAIAPTATGTIGVQDAIQKFLSFLNNSQTQLQNVAGEVKNIKDASSKKGTVNPADLLAVQLKVSFVQQELELFANLLNKALESTKTVMNVQI